MTESSNVYTLTCISCSKDLLKIGVRDGKQEIKVKAECPCGGTSFTKTIKGRFCITPEPDFFIQESVMPPPEVIDVTTGELSNVLGITVFKMRKKQ